MFFLGIIAPALGGGTFLFCALPSAFMYLKRRERCDLINLSISGVTVGVILIEALIMEPLRHQIIFGG